MKSYIHLYKTNQEFTKAYNGPDYVEPWLSLTEENMTIGYSKPKLIAIAFDSITWVKDVPATGGTATKDNCTFKVYAKYDNGISVDISSDAMVTGELTVPSSTATTRHEAGQLTLTASYSGFTATGNVTAYQEAAAPDFSTEPLTFNILSAGTINWTASDSSLTKTIEYKLNDSINWLSITSTTTGAKITVNSGDKVQFRGNNAAYCDGGSSCNMFGGSTAGFEVEGNIMSLIYGDNFATLTTLESNFTFAFLFSNCTRLTSAKNLILPATPLAMGCYFMMFQGCTSLTTAPELPATDLAEGCYNGMFQNCTSLTTAPALPATKLAIACYGGMFQGCTLLTTAPVLPANALVGICYSGMFNGCTSLNYIKCLATDISADYCTQGWVSGVASTGTFVKSPDMTSWATGDDDIPTGWTVEDNQEPLTFNILSAGTINWTASSTDATKTIDYKVNDGAWVSITSNTGSSAPTITVNSGDKLQFRGNNATYANGTSAYNSFSGSTAWFELEGNIMSLIYGDDFKNKLAINDYAFYGLFRDCTNLVSAENLILPATTLADSCYVSMFNGCASLTKAPELPAITLATSCYVSMFNGCASLTKAPELPATTLANYCYSGMFYNCKNLTTAPSVLPAITLANSCYEYMFKGCASLTTAPKLPATTLVDGCYSSMFNGCTSLNYIKCLATDISASNCTMDWVNGVASTGTFVKNPDMASWTTGTSGVPEGWTASGFSMEPLTFKISSPGTINWMNTASKAIEYKLNNGEWTSFTSNTEESWATIEVNASDKIQFRGNNATYSDGDYRPNSSTFGSSTAGFEVEGNIMSLINPKDFDTLTTLQRVYTFLNLFQECTGLTSAENLILPATTLTGGCYYGMFWNCTSLTTAPELPATKLASECYQNMFQGCTRLTTAPALPATTLVNICYKYMFDGCTSLITAPALPARTLADGCYNGMFQNCTSLTTAPALPARTLADGCYGSMFYRCTSLTTAPALPATILVRDCYNSMFLGCTSLTKAPELPATTLANNCYYEMFYNCTKLNYIKCLATDISADYCTYNWVNGVASTGTFVKNPDMTSWTTGDDGIPTGWTVENNQEPLTFNILSDGTINWAASNAAVTRTIDYKLNNGKWVSITSNASSSAPSIEVNSGDKLQFRGNNATYANGTSAYNSFGGSASFELEGNIMSLIYGDEFKNKLTISSAYTFTGLFRECANLVSAENLILPATTLADSCYVSMFNGCASLTKAPELPAITLATSCYDSMFLGCTSLITAPKLPATTLVDSCYSSMFFGCRSLNYIKCLATDISAQGCTSSWVDGVASTGTFVKNPDMASWTTGTIGVPEGWAVEDKQEPLTFKISSPGTINWKASYSSVSKTIEYKLNNGEWVSITSNASSSAPSIEVNSGDKLQFRGNNATYANGTSAYNSFGGSASFELEGNIMSLIYGDDFENKLTISSAYAFTGLFRGCTKLISAENLILPAATLANNCYEYMFKGCTSLTTAPALPATKLASECYQNMFQDCASLTTAPKLPATTLVDSCYNSMFKDCTSLTKAPELPATTLAINCYYNMFANCTSLTTAPALPATNLANSCYYHMFANCTSLTTAPVLPATTLANSCYEYMFYRCTSLTTAPALPATTLATSCYNYMFEGCASLTTAPALPATTLAGVCYDSMFSNCTSLTTAPALPATTLDYYCYRYMFQNCTSLTKAPELPATKLAERCYQYMFSNCTSLTTAPELPATTLANSCYGYMFQGCAKLNYIKCLATNISASNCTDAWVNGVASTGTFVKASSMTSWSTGKSGIPSGWTVQNA